MPLPATPSSVRIKVNEFESGWIQFDSERKSLLMIAYSMNGCQSVLMQA
jgi:hypothetical protein